MNVRKFYRPKLNIKTWNIKDFSALCNDGSNFKSNGGTLKTVFNIEALDISLPDNEEPFYIFYISNTTYIVTVSKKLLKKEDDSYIYVTEQAFASYPNVFGVNLNGVARTLLVSSDKVFVLETQSNLSLSGGEISEVYKDVLFTSNGNDIKFAGRLTNTNALKFNGTYIPDLVLGKVLSMLARNDGLYVLYENGLEKFEIYSNALNTVVERIDIECFNVLNDSLSNVNDKFCFISNNQMCVIDGKKLNVYKSVLDSLSVFQFIYAVSCKNYYIVVISVNSTLRAMCFDTETGESFWLNVENKNILQNGFLFDTEQSALSKLNVSGVANCACSFESIDTDLDIHGIKKIMQISVDTSAPITFILKLGAEQKVFKMKAGCNIRKVGCISERLSFKIYGQGSVEIKNLSIKYGLLGE